jgi:hypothetical protein
MAETDDDKRREALERLREMRGTPESKPQQLLAQPKPQGQAVPGTGAGQAGRLREFLANRNAAGGAGAGNGPMAAQGGPRAGGAGAGGARLREFLANRNATGGVGAGNGPAAAQGGLRAGASGGRLRELLANGQAGGGLAGAAGAGSANAPGAGQGNRPLLRQLLAQRAAGGAAASAPAPVATEPDEDTSPEATRARLRDRIAKMQARLDELDRAAASKAAADGVEDATVIAETPGKSTSD